MSRLVSNKILNTVLSTQQPFRAENIQLIEEMNGLSLEISEVREYLKSLVTNHILTIEGKFYKLDSAIFMA
jgi:hypothetical protein